MTNDKEIERMMNSSRKSANAFGDSGKAKAQRNRRGREWWQAQTALYEKLNKCQPICVYMIEIGGADNEHEGV